MLEIAVIWWVVALAIGLLVGLVRLLRRKRERYEIDDTRAYLESISAGTIPKGAKVHPPSLLGQRISETKSATILRLAMNGVASRAKMMSARLPKDIEENEASSWPGYHDEDNRS